MPLHDALQRPPLTLFAFSRWAYVLDFWAYALLCLALALLVVLNSPASQALALLSYLFLGVFLWCGIEYLIHRFVLHGLPPFKQWHAEHHREPQALMGAPTWLSLSLFALTAALPAGLLLPRNAAMALLLGLLLGYLAYIATHHRVHHAGGARSAWESRRLRWHARHHGRAGSRRRTGHFGVTTGLWDRLARRQSGQRGIWADAVTSTSTHRLT
jgi:hypothetical protein